MDPCQRGHDPSEWRTDKRGWRSCRACRAERRREKRVPKARPTTYKRRDRLELFERHVDKTDDKEYGRFQLESYEPPVGAHRAAWELLVGPIPEGLEVDHVCLTTLCVRPDHLQVVPPKRNAELAGERRAACRKGHPRIEGLYQESKTGRGWTRRRCLVCEGRRTAVALWESMQT